MPSMLKGFALAGLLAIAPAAFTVSPAAAQPQPGRAAACNTAFFVTNATGATIGWLHARPIGAAGWGPDLLGREVITAGASTAVRLPASGRYELKAIAMNGQEFLGTVSACDVAMVTIR